MTHDTHLHDMLTAAVQGRTGEVRIDCPQCEGGQTGTLGINADTGYYQCFRCGLKGNLNNGHAEKKPLPEYLWEQCSPTFDHPYLTEKQVPSYGLRQDKHGNLVIPLYQYGQIATLQFIDAAGKKVLLSKEKGGHKKGSSYTIPGDINSPKKVYVCEGYATASTVRQPTGCTTIMAVDAGNLVPVVNNLKHKYSDHEWIFCADHDSHGKGLEAAKKASAVVSGKVTMPEKVGQDFNDLFAEQGLEAVREQLDKFVDDESAETESPKFQLIQAGALTCKPPAWIVRDYIEDNSLAVIFGDSGSGKSFLGIDISCCVATGKDWMGQPIKSSGPVAYILGEGGNGFARRLRAWSIRHQTYIDDIQLYVSTRPAALCEPQSVAEVVAAIDEIAKATAPRLIVIDTLARNFGAGDENSTQDMGKFVQAADIIRTRYNCSILIIHHTGHHQKGRERGAYPLRGAIDANYRLDKDKAGTVRFTPLKMKEAELPEPMAFEIRSVELGFQDDDGREVTSAILDPVPYEAPTPSQKGRGKNQSKAMSILNGLYEEHKDNLVNGGFDPSTAKVSITDWRNACFEAGIEKSSFSKLKNSLFEHGQIKIEHNYVETIR